MRYIAATEGFDTAESGGTNALFPFLTAANDFYTADISRKVRAALTTRKKEGKFIGSFPPMGYEKDAQVPGTLVPEPEGAEVVQTIFRLFLSGGSVSGVAKQLTEEGVLTPAQRRGGKAVQSRFPGVWSDTMVRRILTNPTYAGHLTQNRSEKLNYKVERRVALSRQEWITIPNTHAPLIGQEDFDRAQQLLAVRSYPNRRGGGGHLFTGLVRCADCGSPMVYVTGARGDSLVCQGYRKGGRLHLCTPHRIQEAGLVEAIQTSLRAMTASLNREELRRTLQSTKTTLRPAHRAPQAASRLEQLHLILERLYSDWAEGLLDKTEFCALLERNRQERVRWETIQRQEQSGQDRKEREVDLEARLEQLLSFTYLDRVTLASLLEQIRVHECGEVEVYFRFCRPN